jgi:hypothetical protein
MRQEGGAYCETKEKEAYNEKTRAYRKTKKKKTC